MDVNDDIMKISEDDDDNCIATATATFSEAEYEKLVENCYDVHKIFRQNFYF